jgi:hypothetical protein
VLKKARLNPVKLLVVTFPDPKLPGLTPERVKNPRFKWINFNPLTVKRYYAIFCVNDNTKMSHSS